MIHSSSHIVKKSIEKCFVQLCVEPFCYLFTFCAAGNGTLDSNSTGSLYGSGKKQCLCNAKHGFYVWHQKHLNGIFSCRTISSDMHTTEVP